MFAYCGNNPANSCDPTGEAPVIWYYLGMEHDYGYVHRAVQNHILLVNNTSALLFSKEVVIPGAGRADIVMPETGEVWEIKHGGSSSTMQDKRIDEALQQIGKYTDNTGYHAGRANLFNGVFTINCDGTSYMVSYNTPEEGVILYYVTPLKAVDPSPYLAYSPSTAPVTNTIPTESYAYAWMAFAFFPSGSLENMSVGSSPIFRNCLAG